MGATLMGTYRNCSEGFHFSVKWEMKASTGSNDEGVSTRVSRNRRNHKKSSRKVEKKMKKI